MTRIVCLVATGALVLAAGSTASAQVNLFLGNPTTGRGAALNVGRPTFNYGYGYGVGPGAAARGINYGFGYGGPRIIVATPTNVAPGAFASPYAGYTTQGYTAITPINPGIPNPAYRRYQAGTSYYSSGYSGYSAGRPGYGVTYPGSGVAGSGATIIQQRYTTTPFNAYGTNPVFGYGAGYRPLSGGRMDLNRRFGPPLR